MTRWRCEDCDVISDDSALLHAPNPFSRGDEIAGCPHCRSVPEFTEICDEPGCNEAASCGFPVAPSGYRRTCFNHSTFRKDKP
jgi:hypothetical protein